MFPETTALPIPPKSPLPRPGLDTRSDIVQLAAIGIHVHQGDFGPFNLWLNNLVAVALIWLSATGIVSSWTRRPEEGRSVRPHATVGLIIAVVAMAVPLPIFGLSVAVIAAGSRLARVRAYPLADPDRKASGNVQDGSSNCDGSGDLVDGVGYVGAATLRRN